MMISIVVVTKLSSPRAEIDSSRLSKNKGVANRNVARQPRTNDEQDSDWILSEICQKCIILVTNLQKSPYAGNSPSLVQHYYLPIYSTSRCQRSIQFQGVKI